MTTTYLDFREAVRLAVVEASGLDDAAVGWAQDGEACADPWIVLTVVSDVRECPIRENLEASGDDYGRSLTDMRRVAVQIRVESLRADALSLANEISLKLQSQAAREILDAECTYINDTPTQDHRYRSRDLVIQARSFEILLRIVLEYTDPTGVGTIGTVQVQGDTLDLPPEVTLDEDTISEDD